MSVMVFAGDGEECKSFGEAQLPAVGYNIRNG
jgi:hypothetical protein